MKDNKKYKTYYIEHEINRVNPLFREYTTTAVSATNETDAVLRYCHEQGIKVTDDNLKNISVISKSEYQIKKLFLSESLIESDLRILERKTKNTRKLCIASISMSGFALGFAITDMVLRILF